MSAGDVPVTIVGGGITGMAAALALEKRGVGPVVVATRTAQEADPFLTLGPRGLLAAGLLGVDVEEHPAAQRGPEGRGTAIEQVVLLRRSSVLEMLETAAAGTVQRTGACTALAGVSQGIEVRLADGSSYITDLVLGCDGADSVVRSTFLGQRGSPGKQRYAIWQGLFDVPSELHAPLGIWHGLEGSVEVTPAGEGRRLWMGVSRGASERAPHEAPSLDPLKLAMEVFADLPDPVQEVIRRTPPEALAFEISVRRRPLTKWGGRHFTLLGSAAYQVSPLTRLGATLALEDGIVAAACIDLVGRSPAALRVYESRRFERVLSVRRAGHALELARLGMRVPIVRHQRWRRRLESAALRRLDAVSARPALEVA